MSCRKWAANEKQIQQGEFAMKIFASVRKISVLTVLMIVGGCGSGDDPSGASGEPADARPAPAGGAPKPIVSSDPFYGASPEAVANKVFVQLGGERSGMTPEVVLEALLSDPVDNVAVEVRGVKLGMTLEEAEAALMASMPQGSSFEVTQYGGVGHLIGDPPSGPLTAATPGAYPVKASGSDPRVSKETVTVEFAPPPAKSVVQSITRNHPIQFSENDTQTSVEVYRQTLIDEYGPPDDEITLGTNMGLKWLYSSDEVDCTSWRGVEPNWVYQRAGHPADCSTALVYSLSAGADGIVTRAHAWLGNPGLLQLNLLANRALFEALREKANAEANDAAMNKPSL